MREHFVLEALQTLNRFQLCRLAAKATRRLHKRGNRVQDTANDVFRRLVKENSNCKPGESVTI
jgi:hypothetical protein